MGKLDSCHNAIGGNTISSFWQASGQGMFGKNTHIYYYRQADCKGSAVDYKLTNQAGCQAAGGDGEYRSFMIATSGSCSNKPAQPSNSGDNTLTLSLHASSCCTDTAFETTTTGKFGVCNKAKKGFKGVTERVGTNLFGRDLHVWAFKDHACGGSSPAFKNDNTVTLKLFSDDCCTETQTFSLGTLGTCHTPSAGSFTGLIQATGENIFGRGVKIWAYPDSTSCAGDNRVGIAVSGNEGQCYWLGSGSSRVAFRSFKIDTGSLGSGGGGGGGGGGGDDDDHGNDQGPAPGCDAAPTPYSDNSVQLSFYGDSDCCAAFQATYIGTLNSCHNAKGTREISRLRQAPGRGLFGQSIHHLWVFEKDNCLGAWQGLSLTCNGGCQLAGGNWRSYMITKSALSSGPHDTGGGSGGGGGGGGGDGGGGGGSGGGPCLMPPVKDIPDDQAWVFFYDRSDTCEDVCRGSGASVAKSVSALLGSLGYAAANNIVSAQGYGIQAFTDEYCGILKDTIVPVEPFGSTPLCMSQSGLGGLIRSWRIAKANSTLDIGPGNQPQHPSSHQQIRYEGGDPCDGTALTSGEAWFEKSCDGGKVELR
ncbi:hypothetical protein GE09DRAFT_1229149 [Coniochaeta sp. 2T2.1]|nr:hypothetical protein GE09DRAFT_1229149 [Coniochaeta sp. 2T2.1]